MKLITVRCWRLGDEEKKYRVGVTVANSGEEAKELCRADCASEGYSRFEVVGEAEHYYKAPARLLFYATPNILEIEAHDC